MAAALPTAPRERRQKPPPVNYHGRNAPLKLTLMAAPHGRQCRLSFWLTLLLTLSAYKEDQQPTTVWNGLLAADNVSIPDTRFLPTCPPTKITSSW